MNFYVIELIDLLSNSFLVKLHPPDVHQNHRLNTSDSGLLQLQVHCRGSGESREERGVSRCLRERGLQQNYRCEDDIITMHAVSVSRRSRRLWCDGVEWQLTAPLQLWQDWLIHRPDLTLLRTPWSWRRDPAGSLILLGACFMISGLGLHRVPRSRELSCWVTFCFLCVCVWMRLRRTEETGRQMTSLVRHAETNARVKDQ